MLGHRSMGVEDYISILRRRLWIILIPALVFPVLAYGVSLFLPQKFTSQTLVLVEPPKVPSSILPVVVNDQINERLATMQQQILSRSQLEPLIKKFGLFRTELARGAAVEDLVNRMQKQDVLVSTIRPLAGSKPGDLPGFTISFTADDPRIAQQVCQEITSKFIEKNLELREKRAQGTTQFLEQQVADAKKRLDEKDERVKAFKQKYLGSLPGQEQYNMNILMNLTSQLEATTSLLNRTQQDKVYVEALLQQQTSAWEASQQATAQAGANPQTLDQQLAALKSTLVSLEAQYTSEHPDVVKAKRDIAQLEKRIKELAEAPKDQKSSTAANKLNEPPQLQQLRNQIHTYQQVIADNTKKQKELDERIKTYRARVEVSPLVEAEWNEINRDYTTAQGFYDDLLKKRDQARLGTVAEQQQQAETFRLIDPPNLPERPSYPNRMMFAAGGFGAGFALGFMIVLALEFRDKAIRTERDIEAFLQLPTLAMVPGLSAAARARSGVLSRFRKAPQDERVGV